MDFWLAVLMRWAHVAAAVVGVGSTILFRFVVLPAISKLSEPEAALAAIRPGFKRVIHSAIGLLLLTGFYNYMVLAIPRVAAAGEKMKAYHPVMGVKIILSLVLFGVAMALLSQAPAFHKRRNTWLTVNSVLGLVILLLAAFLRRLW